MFEQVSLTSASVLNLTGLSGSGQHGRSLSKPITTYTRPASTNYCVTWEKRKKKEREFYSSATGQNVPIKKHSPYQKSTGKRHVCYDSSSATPPVAHFLAVSVIARTLQYLSTDLLIEMIITVTDGQ